MSSGLFTFQPGLPSGFKNTTLKIGLAKSATLRYDVFVSFGNFDFYLWGIDDNVSATSVVLTKEA
jgi:hypothetical protein